MNVLEKAKGISLTSNKLTSNSVVVQMTGYLDTYNSKSVQDQVDQIIEEGVIYFIFDLTKMNYISSTGIGVFVNTLKRVRESKGDIILVGMQRRVSEVFELLGFATFFATSETVDEAVEYLPSVTVQEVIPFERMDALTASFKALEGYVQTDNVPEFYSLLLQILQQIEELKAQRGL